MANLWQNNAEGAWDSSISSGRGKGWCGSLQVLGIIDVIRDVAMDAISESRHATSDRVIKVKRKGTIRNGFVSERTSGQHLIDTN
jgi:hypothetical protein